MIALGFTVAPSGGEAGGIADCMHPSVRSSVFSGVCEFFTTEICQPQEKPTSGFYAGQSGGVVDEMSTRSGRCLTLKTSPTLARNRSQLCAELSLRGASTLHFFTALEQSTLTLSSSPKFAAWKRAAFFTSIRVSRCAGSRSEGEGISGP